MSTRSSHNDGTGANTPLTIVPETPPSDNEAAEKAFAAEAVADPAPPRKAKNRRRLVLWLIPVILALLAGIAVIIYFFAVKPKQNKESDNKASDSNGGSQSSTSSGAGPEATQPAVVFIGHDGDEVTMENGQTFTYKNSFGGYFVDASKTSDPFNDGARPQEFSKALNETWDYAADIMRGGWLVLEPFITPAFYQKYQNTSGFDSSEWTLTEAMRADTAGGGIQQIETHYAEFITEQDFAEIAGAGLNWVRIPIPYWAIEVYDGEPFIAKTSWTYALKAFEWARKYGLRVNLDLHTVPGSQNGKSGNIGWMSGVMGYANAQRTLDYIRIITEFISQPQYKNVVPIFGIINEPRPAQTYLSQFYLEAYTMIRGITGVGAGNGPIISIHDSFDATRWLDFLPGADRLAVDAHRYFAFSAPTFIDRHCYFTVNRPCGWVQLTNQALEEFGIFSGGEWSLGFNDCGRFLVNGVENTHGTLNCDFWDNYQAWNQTTKDQLTSFALASMEGLRNFFFWTWKIAPAASGNIEAPLWSYQLGLQEGYMPKDPRDATGHCQKVGMNVGQFNGVLPASATGGPGAPKTLAPAATAGVMAWPRLTSTIYTATGPVPTLPGPTLSPPATATISGWAYPQDTNLMSVPIEGCTYPDPWEAGTDLSAVSCPAAA
ncbi:glycoside hydrolase family 5 protein [Auriculariales sp. MPI-PUGE-AT-0066]|nr:glycoside hydrolase family 5 protein [Auriculariales sp. MPI-PUGE-AT-0066]